MIIIIIIAIRFILYANEINREINNQIFPIPNMFLLNILGKKSLYGSCVVVVVHSHQWMDPQ